MLSEKTIRELISTPVFISNASKLAYMLHMSQKDASQELLLELLGHRLRQWSSKDVTLSVQRDLPSLKWRIKYARKDLVRQSNRSAARELTKSQMMAGMEPHVSSQSETLEALGRLPELFKNANTRDWAESVLRVGKQETMIQFHQSPRQFANKLVKVCKYARQHRHQQPNSNTKELHILSEWNDLMVDPDTDDNCIQAFINSHQDYINEVIINTSLIKFQGKVLKDFAQAGKDKYTFNELMHTQYIKLEQELKENK
ncbi:hypothetical protein Lpp41_07564 [Lacticaseibacillus paracasei subsp. paracasei Lpp41]|uniref:Uncharacterized protein n=1 Tax=Lacticaseibacillus paracasei subsp. paracasei Lpp41 TaxID=1256208 RepID=A0A829H7K7_LACPA|nr:hypothetical protein Lpp41_07564 [Lacticaseibacillus paracasei subsp. paracasei Lpp41]